MALDDPKRLKRAMRRGHEAARKREANFHAFERFRRAMDIADNPKAWEVFAQRLVDANLGDIPLVVLGQGGSAVEYYGKDCRLLSPPRKAPLRTKRAALSLLKTSLLLRCESVVRALRAALSFLRVRR